jgi:hypothetical protein
VEILSNRFNFEVQMHHFLSESWQHKVSQGSKVFLTSSKKQVI